MVLLNGRMRWLYSRFTCYKYYEASAVGYVIADYNILNAVKQFDVKHKTPDSDHCPLTYVLNNLERLYPDKYADRKNKAVPCTYINGLSMESRRYFNNFLCDIV